MHELSLEGILKGLQQLGMFKQSNKINAKKTKKKKSLHVWKLNMLLKVT
jgi:hypothetical protein